MHNVKQTYDSVLQTVA